jgi:DNA mismatch repair protein MSH6
LLKLLNRCVTPFGEFLRGNTWLSLIWSSGKRLFRIWLCMPLKDIGDINSRYDSLLIYFSQPKVTLLFRLDAVEDLLNSPTFEKAFAEIAKGLPDLERVVSRIHAKNCSVKDFLKVLGVSDSSFLFLSLPHLAFTVFQEAHPGTE